MLIAHLGSIPAMLGMGLGTQSMAVAGMFGFQIMMGASSPGMYAMSQILAGRKASGRWVGIQNSSGISRARSRPGSPASSSIAPGTSRSPSWPPP